MAYRMATYKEYPVVGDVFHTPSLKKRVNLQIAEVEACPAVVSVDNFWKGRHECDFLGFNVTLRFGEAIESLSQVILVLQMHIDLRYPFCPPECRVEGFDCPPFDANGEHSPQFTLMTYVDGFLAMLNDPVRPPKYNPTITALWHKVHPELRRNATILATGQHPRLGEFSQLSIIDSATLMHIAGFL